MGYRLLACAAVLGMMASGSATAGGGGAKPDGAKLHDQSCTRCHGSEVYGDIGSRDGLRDMVVRCANQAAKVDWSDAQVTAVTDYLTRFYPFE